MVWRQPFPGPGLAIRVLGDITEEKLEIVRETDAILREEVKNAGLNREIWQYFTVFTPLRTVGVKGDERSYDYVVVVRAVSSKDAMTVESFNLPYELQQTVLHLPDKKVLYISGEESARQLKLRADRIPHNSSDCLIVCETSLEQIYVHIKNTRPDLVIIDSIQTISTETIDSSPGSLVQVRECSASILKFAKIGRAHV